MYITFSQQKLKQEWNPRIRRIWNKVKTKSTPDLWLKVFIHRTHKHMIYTKNYEQKTIETCEPTSGHYRKVFGTGHGFYHKEWFFIRRHQKIDHVITLKIAECATDKQIASLMAHEYRHYLQFHNGRPKKHTRIEMDANRWAEKRLNKLGFDNVGEMSKM